jgi:hypothetical protein
MEAAIACLNHILILWLHNEIEARGHQMTQQIKVSILPLSCQL